jgi:hypothetical protein
MNALSDRTQKEKFFHIRFPENRMRFERRYNFPRPHKGKIKFVIMEELDGTFGVGFPEHSHERATCAKRLTRDYRSSFFCAGTVTREMDKIIVRFESSSCLSEFKRFTPEPPPKDWENFTKGLSSFLTRSVESYL